VGPFPAEWFIGPVAALVLALAVLWIGGRIAYRILREYIDDLKVQRDEWKTRSLSSDTRLERIADAFEALAKKAAPK
jgi:hypothetical protein